MKTQILNYLLDVNEGVLNGDTNALEVYVELRTIEKCLKNVLDGVHEAALTEAEKYGKGEHEAFGCKFQLRNGSSRWDFSKVSEHKELKGQMKQLEDSLKALVTSGKFNFADADTGEVVELPIRTYSKDTLALKL